MSLVSINQHSTFGSWLSESRGIALWGDALWRWIRPSRNLFVCGCIVSGPSLLLRCLRSQHFWGEETRGKGFYVDRLNQSLCKEKKDDMSCHCGWDKDWRITFTKNPLYRCVALSTGSMFYVEDITILQLPCCHNRNHHRTLWFCNFLWNSLAWPHLPFHAVTSKRYHRQLQQGASANWSF